MKKNIILLSFLLLPSFFSFNKEIKIEAKDDGLIYSLDFEDSGALGKNSAGDFADATIYQKDNHVYQVDRGESKALYLDGTTSFENYLSLPTKMFEGQNSITIGGWFYHPTGVEAYQGEIGIFSPENNLAFRTDQYANYHSDCYLYLFGNTECFNSLVYPVYDAWYHMAYTVNSDGEVKVYQNGHYVRTFNTNLVVSNLHSATSHFYLGQSAYETNHNDYIGGFDDIKVYNKVLNEEEIKKNFNLNNLDFLIDEYTFDSEETLLKDNIRGYNIEPDDANATGANTTNTPVYENGAMRLNNCTATLSKVSSGFGEPVNPKYLFGLSEVSFVMDIRESEDGPINWERIFDIFADSGQRISFMAHTGGNGTIMNIVYANKDFTGVDWMLNDTNSCILKQEAWYNLGVVIKQSSMEIFVDGVKIATVTGLTEFMSKIYNFESSDNSWFTLGSPVYESNRYINALFDNIRIYAASLDEDDFKEILKTSHLYSTVSIDGEEFRHIDSEEYTLEEKTKDGYYFVGYEDQNGNIYKDVLPSYSGDVVLTSKFEKLKATITYDANGAIGNMDSSYVINDSITLAKINYVKHGYDFMGWATSPNGEVIYEDGATINNLDKDLTLYAIFKARTYTITYDANGGEGSMETSTYTTDSNGKLLANSFTRNGYDFVGWASTPSGLKEYDDEASFTTLKAGVDTTLYACWLLKSYVVSFNANGGEGVMDRVSGDAFSYIQLPDNDFSNGDRTFLGWAVSPDGDVIYQDEDLIYVDDNIILYAIYSKYTYNISFDGDNSEYIEGETIIAPSAPSKDGYTFIGWYYNDEEFKEGMVASKDMTFVAKYEENKAEEEPTKKKGCKGAASSSLFILLAFVILKGKALKSVNKPF